MSIKRLHVGPRLSQVAIHEDTVYTARLGDPIEYRASAYRRKSMSCP